MDLANIFEWAGVSLGQEETYLIFLSIKKLVESKTLKSARLFGKIFGTTKDYIVVESERRDDDEAGEEEAEAAPEATDTTNVNPDEQDLPKSKHKVTPAPVKEVAAGVNRYIYWVCNFRMC